MGLHRKSKKFQSKIKRVIRKTKSKITGRRYINKPQREENKELASFIKDNIINKESEYPEYDNATFESTMKDLKEAAEKVSEDDISLPDYETLDWCMDKLFIMHPKNAGEFEKQFTRSEALRFIDKEIKKLRELFMKTTGEEREIILNKLLDIAPYVDVFENIKHVYIINGYARSGKDTFIKMAGKEFIVGNEDIPYSTYTTSISSVQGIKDISAFYFGYDENRKNDKDRKFLSDLKALTTDYCDFSMNYILKQVITDDIFGAKYIFIHIREPKEIDRAKEMVGEIIFPHFSKIVTQYDYDTDTLISARKFFDVKTVFVVNDRVKAKVTNNASDTDVEKYNYDFRIYNNGSLDDLRKEAHRFVDSELKKESEFTILRAINT